MKNSRKSFLTSALFLVFSVQGIYAQPVFSMQNPVSQTQVLPGKNTTENKASAFNNLVTELDQAQTLADYQWLENSFSGMAKKDAQNWLAHYYVALCDIKIARILAADTDRAERYIVHGSAAVRKAGLLLDKQNRQKELSEVYTLASMFYQACPVDTYNGQAIETRATEYLHLARRLDPQNPRAIYLDAFVRYHAAGATAEDKKLARQMAEISLSIIRKDKTGVMPHWGETENEELLNQ